MLTFNDRTPSFQHLAFIPHYMHSYKCHLPYHIRKVAFVGMHVVRYQSEVLETSCLIIENYHCIKSGAGK